MEMGKSEHDWLEQRFGSMTAKERLLFQGAMQLEHPQTVEETLRVLRDWINTDSSMVRMMM